MNIYNRYAEFVRSFIYQNNWESLRAVQVAAGDVIFNSDDNLLLSASTAAGKTEAAFFPILTLFDENPPQSVGAIYIGPLKALINDQFMRLNDLCYEADIPVWHWHGDVSQSHKAKLLRHPSGILQITPESLEALLIRKHSHISRLFHDLRFVVIDEVHSLMRGDRGGQTLCLIERLGKLAGCNPRRIGLSATIGDLEETGAFLSHGSGRKTAIPRIEVKGTKWRLSMEHFYVQGTQAADGSIAAAQAADGSIAAAQAKDGSIAAVRAADSGIAAVRAADGGTAAAQVKDGIAADSGIAAVRAADGGTAAAQAKDGIAADSGSAAVQARDGKVQSDCATAADGADVVVQTALDEKTDEAPSLADPAFGYIYEHTKGKKCLVFVNSREECEAVTTKMRQYCEYMNAPDRFLIHHGNLSAAFRQTAEEVMKDEEQYQTTITTSTLELGIDIGRLERAFQINAPFMVSSFLQRMGRTGRRDLPPEMWFVMREEQPESRGMLTLPWDLLQGIALIQLYMEEKWVEPPKTDRLPYSLLYHQTMSTLASCGEMSAAALASRVLALKFFYRISQEDYKVMLRHLITTEHIQRTERGGLIVGLAGERITNSFKFYAVFKEDEEYTVRSKSQELGTMCLPPPVGEKIAIAGHVWIVEEIDHKRHLIYCEQVKGSIPGCFGQCPGDINTRVLERIKQVLSEDTVYPYMMKNAVTRLEEARRISRNSGMLESSLINLGGEMWCLFPWLGTYGFLALERFLKLKCADKLGISGLDSRRPYFMIFKMKKTENEFFRILKEIEKEPLDPMDLIYKGETPYFEKYDEFLPPELVKKGFAYGILAIDEMKKRISSWQGNVL